MRRGDSVLVRVYPGRTVDRVVWEAKTTYVVCCRKEVFETAIREGTEPESSMGFPKEDVKISYSEAPLGEGASV